MTPDSGPSCGFASGGSSTPAIALEHLLAGPVVVRPVVEHDADVRQAQLRFRLHEHDVRDPVQLVLERNRDDPLELLGGVPRPQGDDLDRDVADVRIRLDRKPLEGGDAAHRQQRREGQRDEPLLEREVDQARDHDRRLVGPGPALSTMASILATVP